MYFGYLGINYKNAPLDIRDKASFTDSRKLEFFRMAEAEGVQQCMILSTCNRSEVYFFYEYEEQMDRMRLLYTGLFRDADLSGCLTWLTGGEALAYLFRIAAGLESLVLGEDQILGQVRDALDFSRTVGYAGKELNKVVRDAITCAKRIKTELKISEKPLSVSYVGIRRLDGTSGIAGKRVLVIGSGRTAALALKYLYDYGATRVTACSRTITHARELRDQFPEIEVISYEERYREMEACDIVISATSSPHLTVKAERFRPRRPVTFLDLASPRDVDMELAKLPGVRIINLDSLQVIVEENRRERERLVEESGAILREELEETLDWLRTSRMDSTIQSLQQRCGEIVEDSYDYLNRKMELGAREQKLVRKVLNASLQRLLREPIRELKCLDTEEQQEAYGELVKKLFQV